MRERERDYSYEALAEVTSTDWDTGRGELNAALRDIRAQEPALASVENSYLLSAEIHDRAQIYRQVFEGAALTPTALAKHWRRLPEEARKLKRGGTNLHAGAPDQLPARSSQKRNLAELEKLKSALWPSDERDIK